MTMMCGLPPPDRGCRRSYEPEACGFCRSAGRRDGGDVRAAAAGSRLPPLLRIRGLPVMRAPWLPGYAARMGPHARALRTGRFSEVGRIYLVTTVTHRRARLGDDFHLARCVIHELRKTDASGSCQTLAYVLMPDHLHWLVQLQAGTLSSLVARFKSNAAAALNRQLGTPGEPRWQRGFHDHALREEEDLVHLARYIVANPVRAGLAGRVGDYAHWDAVWL
jgi:REP element-mobilizing transposase RayT